MADPLDTLPCPCCGRCDARPLLYGVGWRAYCSCGHIWICHLGDVENAPTVRRIVTRIGGVGVPENTVQAVLRALGLTDEQIRSLAAGARLEVVR